MQASRHLLRRALPNLNLDFWCVRRQVSPPVGTQGGTLGVGSSGQPLGAIDEVEVDATQDGGRFLRFGEDLGVHAGVHLGVRPM